MIRTAALSDVGIKRKLNEDRVFTSELPVGNLPNLFIIADGMGGHKAGDYAAQYAVETIYDTTIASPEHNPESVIGGAIAVANRDIFRLSRMNAEQEGMGTTIVACSIYGSHMKVANVGDSRLYLIHGKTIKQVTVDHSLVEEMVRAGSLDRAVARIHPNKNIITRAVGVTESVEVDFFDVELAPGDLVLLCSDGLSNMLDDEEIRMLTCAQRDLVEKAEALVRAANNNGGRDNISLILIEPFAGEVEND